MRFYLVIPGGILQQKIAWICKLCVAIYAFISGYGINKSKTVIFNENNYWLDAYSDSLRRILRFLCKYWLVYFVVVPVGLILHKYSFNIPEMINNFIARRMTYSSEWWYVQQYISMLLLFPIIQWIFSKIDILKSRREKIFLLLLSIVWCSLLFNGKLVSLINQKYQLVYLAIFTEGIICAKYKIFERISDFLQCNLYRKCWAVMITIVCFVIRWEFAKGPEYIAVDTIITVPLIYAVTINVRETDRLKNLLIKIGEKSVYMWLIHTFFCYYFFQNVITCTKIALLAYLETFASSYFAASILITIENKIIHIKR